MNEKLQAILLKIVKSLKNLGWSAANDWEITLKSEGYVPMVKQIGTDGAMEDEEWRDEVEVLLKMKISSMDQLTYFPDYSIFAHIKINGGDDKDIVHEMEADVAFTEKDVRKDDKITLAANKIDRLVESHIEQEYADYVENNAQKIKNYMQNRGNEQPPQSPSL